MVQYGYDLLLLLSAFSHQGSPQRIFNLQLLLSSASSSFTSIRCPLSPTSSLAFPASSFLATPSSASFSQYTHHLSSVHVHTTSVFLFSLQTVQPVLSLWCTHSWFCPFLSLLMKIVTSSTLPPPCLFVSATVSNPYNISLVHLPFHSSWYSPIANHSCPTIPSCLYSLLHFSSAFSITLYSWAQIFEILHFRDLFSLIFTVPLSCLSFTHMYCLSPIDFHSSSLQSISLSSFRSSHADHNVLKTYGWSFLSDIISYPIHHHCKQTRAQYGYDTILYWLCEWLSFAEWLFF